MAGNDRCLITFPRPWIPNLAKCSANPLFFGRAVRESASSEVMQYHWVPKWLEEGVLRSFKGYFNGLLGNKISYIE